VTSTSSSGPSALSDRAFFVVNGALSLVAVAIIAWLLLVRHGTAGAGVDLRFMPAVNAALNATSAALLSAGWLAIRRGDRALHPRLMLGAFAASGLFLLGYLAYHAVHGDTRYPGSGAMRTVYLALLASHVVLSIPVVPMSFTTLWWASRGRLAQHRAIARVTLPLWLYVSVTGVLVYVMLRGASPAVP
jgi:putative membrane protein